MIARLDLRAIDNLRETLPQLAEVPLAHLNHVTPNRRRAYWLDEICQSLAKESALAFGSTVAGTINGFIVYNDSPWDSQITGRRIGSVEHLAVTSDHRVATEI